MGELQGEVRGPTTGPYILPSSRPASSPVTLDALHIKPKTLAEVATVLLSSASSSKPSPSCTPGETRRRCIPGSLNRMPGSIEPPSRGPDDYDVIGKDGEKLSASTGPGPAGMPWMWTLATRQDGEDPVLGYEATRNAAMEAFAMSWHPGEKGT